MTDAEAQARPLRLLVVDDHEVVRQGLVALLERRPGFEIVAEAGTAAQAVSEAARFEQQGFVADEVGGRACRERTELRPR